MRLLKRSVQALGLHQSAFQLARTSAETPIRENERLIEAEGHAALQAVAQIQQPPIESAAAGSRWRRIVDTEQQHRQRAENKRALLQQIRRRQHRQGGHHSVPTRHRGGDVRSRKGKTASAAAPAAALELAELHRRRQEARQAGSHGWLPISWEATIAQDSRAADKHKQATRSGGPRAGPFNSTRLNGIVESGPVEQLRRRWSLCNTRRWIHGQ